MKTTKELKELFVSGEKDELLRDIYIDEALLDYQRQRYADAISRYEELYGCGEAEIYSAPGRSEIGGNHTDHQNGEVLAASINLDAIGIVGKLDGMVKVVSGTAPQIEISLDDLDVKEEGGQLTNRLFYLAPQAAAGVLRCFFYYEENLFEKEETGEWRLRQSSFHLFQA